MTATVQASAVERGPGSGVVGRRRTAFGLAVPILLAGVLVVLVAGLALDWLPKNLPVTFSTPYQAVLLTNGSVYFGKLQGYGTPNPVLTDAFYVVSHADPTTKQVSNVLIKRGKELHGPDRMYINPNQLVFVETVGPTSKVAQLISRAADQ